jgi:hypothetical protein
MKNNINTNEGFLKELEETNEKDALKISFFKGVVTGIVIGACLILGFLFFNILNL